ncbi:ABC-2 transporter permease [Lysinibacillus sp. 54212]|uniref:ABC-2 transporter permease n=1 Tax=Lysinibacillus sp. 54212 TaxID=3119829 RepID=UPI002FCB0F0A
MLALLKLQWELSKHLFLIHIIFVIGIGVFLTTKIYSAQLAAFGFYISVTILSNTFFLSSNHFYRLLAIMPIGREKVVKSIALISLLFIVMTFSIISPFLLLANNPTLEATETLSFISFFFSCAIVSSAVQQYFLFTDEKLEIDFGENMLSMLASLLLLFPHALFYIIQHEPTIYLRLLVAPALALAFYYWRMKANIAYLEKKEIF